MNIKAFNIRRVVYSAVTWRLGSDFIIEEIVLLLTSNLGRCIII